MTTQDQKEERRQRAKLAAENAKKVIKHGDRLRVKGCAGTKCWITFECWCGNWIISKSGRNDYHPVNVDMINGKPVDFTQPQPEQEKEDN